MISSMKKGSDGVGSTCLPFVSAQFTHHILIPGLDITLASCVCVCVCVCVYSDAQSCPTFCEPMDCTPPGSSVHGILQARMLEWVAISFSRGSSLPRDLLYLLHWQAGSLPTEPSV